MRGALHGSSSTADRASMFPPSCTWTNVYCTQLLPIWIYQKAVEVTPSVKLLLHPSNLLLNILDFTNLLGMLLRKTHPIKDERRGKTKERRQRKAREVSKTRGSHEKICGLLVGAVISINIFNMAICHLPPPPSITRYGNTIEKPRIQYFGHATRMKSIHWNSSRKTKAGPHGHHLSTFSPLVHPG